MYILVDNQRSVKTAATWVPSVSLKHADYPLLPTSSHIRILDLKFDPVNIILCADFRVIDLDNESNPDFHALSYACGDPTPIGYIEFPSIPLKPQLGIGANLFQALHRLRRQVLLRDENTISLWIDAVCINQADLDERAQQVKLMHRIFGSASGVLGWLGPGEDESLSTTEQLLQKYANPLNNDDGGVSDWVRHFGLAGHLTMGNDGWATRNAAIASLSSSTSKAQLELLHQFFNRAWFTRLWIVQEGIVAKRLAILCGNNMTISYDFVGFAASWYFTVQSTYGYLTSADRNIMTQPTTVFNMRNDYQVLKKKLVLERLLQLPTFESSEPRDEVFALIGIMKVPPEVSTLLEVDYRKPVKQVHIDAARAVLLAEKKLDVLNRACCPHRPPEDGLPSWVPNRKYWKEVWVTSPYRMFDAASGKRATFLASESKDELCLRGTKRELIMSSIGVGDESLDTESNPGIRICNTICLFYSTMIQMKPDISDFDEIFAEMTTCGIEILDNNPVHIRTQLRDEFRDFTFHWAREIGLKLPDEYRRSMAQAIIDELTGKVDVATLHEVDGSRVLPNRYAKTMLATCANASLVSVQGKFGISARVANKGDIVAVLEGGRFPMILRRIEEEKAARPSQDNGNDPVLGLREEAQDVALRVHGKEYWKLVGPAYIYGLMNGEAFQPNKETGCELDLEEYSII